MIDQIVQKAMKEAIKAKIPLVGEVVFSRTGERNMTFAHYDFGQALALSEVQLVSSIVRAAARSLDADIAYTLETLRYAVVQAKTGAIIPI